MKGRIWKFGKEVVIFDQQRNLAKSAIATLRPHHYIKNCLLFLPLLLAHSFDVASLLHAGLGFIAFSAAASATYIINDLVDIEADRMHSEKRNRPFASGSLPVKYGPIMIAVLFFVAALAALYLPPLFRAGLSGYIILTTIYSFRLKRKVLVDVFMLASFYTLRIIAGGWAAGVPVSNWLLGVSAFMFTSIAFAKRGIELYKNPPEGDGLNSRRGYTQKDLPMIQQMGIASAYSSVLMLALYIGSEKVTQMYSHPNVLWLVCPVVLYWLLRFWIKAHRGLLHHDPLIDAVRDPVSLSCILVILVIAIVSI